MTELPEELGAAQVAHDRFDVGGNRRGEAQPLAQCLLAGSRRGISLRGVDRRARCDQDECRALEIHVLLRRKNVLCQRYVLQARYAVARLGVLFLRQSAQHQRIAQLHHDVGISGRFGNVEPISESVALAIRNDEGALRVDLELDHSVGQKIRRDGERDAKAFVHGHDGRAAERGRRQHTGVHVDACEKLGRQSLDRGQGGAREDLVGRGCRVRDIQRVRQRRNRDLFGDHRAIDGRVVERPGVGGCARRPELQCECVEQVDALARTDRVLCGNDDDIDQHHSR